MRRFNDSDFNKHYVYLDETNTPLLLPCLFARYTQLSGVRIDFEVRLNSDTKLKEEVFFENEIGADAGYKITNHLGRFLEWVSEYEDSSLVTLPTHTALPNEVINEYINEYLIGECESSEFVANQAVNSLTAYYDWLFYFFKVRKKKVGIKSSFRETARNNNKGDLAVKYLLPQTRQLFYRNAESLLEEIVLRNGGELGCRTKENQGFLLNAYKANQKYHSGLLTLFELYETNSEQLEFKYTLPSIYTKYGRERVLYIPRELLSKMKEYYEIERPKSDSNHLLVSSAPNSFGQCISKAYGSDTFRKIRDKLKRKIQVEPEFYVNVQEITSGSKYHHLRHSFGTDFFYESCEGANKKYETITTTSSVYIETARRLGHKVDSRHAGEVTKRYIHSCGLRERLLREVVNNG
ncbi:site-specific integrase [Colwellia sp. 1_MG-2023]|uniref:site-specific integrase n=1 Tax=Colwellia sp. 1_MG-2023 TaxID=3062649 RepID=UPI0026E1EF15|nr:site-specific integrase [Colwellia sp. 1_MG-2023]MDO6444188.1 site-specific integrase [Colwellia sp. 1_MG-2023]